MTEAVATVKEKKTGYLKASKTYIPKKTLSRYVRNTPKKVIETKLGRKSVFPPDHEAQLVIYFIRIEKRLCGWKSCNIRPLSFNLQYEMG